MPHHVHSPPYLCLSMYYGAFGTTLYVCLCVCVFVCMRSNIFQCSFNTNVESFSIGILCVMQIAKGTFICVFGGWIRCSLFALWWAIAIIISVFIFQRKSAFIRDDISWTESTMGCVSVYVFVCVSMCVAASPHLSTLEMAFQPTDRADQKRGRKRILSSTLWAISLSLSLGFRIRHVFVSLAAFTIFGIVQLVGAHCCCGFLLCKVRLNVHFSHAAKVSLSQQQRTLQAFGIIFHADFALNQLKREFYYFFLFLCSRCVFALFPCLSPSLSLHSFCSLYGVVSHAADTLNNWLTSK